MSKRGPKPKYGETAADELRVRVTAQQRLRLQHAAKVNLTTVANLVRDAVDDYMLDFSDEPLFDGQAEVR
jgi:hypothetical protein